MPGSSLDPFLNIAVTFAHFQLSGTYPVSKLTLAVNGHLHFGMGEAKKGDIRRGWRKSSVTVVVSLVMFLKDT